MWSSLHSNMQRDPHGVNALQSTDIIAGEIVAGMKEKIELWISLLPV